MDSSLDFFPERSQGPELRLFLRPHALQTRLGPWRRQTGVLRVPQRLQLCNVKVVSVAEACRLKVAREWTGGEVV